MDMPPLESRRCCQKLQKKKIGDCKKMNRRSFLPISENILQCTWKERLQYKGHIILKWKSTTNPDNMSIHENFRDAVRQRATLAQQEQCHTYIPPQERTRQRPIDLNLRSQVSDECQQRSHLCQLVQYATLGMSSTVASVATRRMARSAIVGDEVHSVALSPHLFLQEPCTFVFFKISLTDITECRARDERWRQNTRRFFSLRSVQHICHGCFTCHVSSSALALAQGLVNQVSMCVAYWKQSSLHLKSGRILLGLHERQFTFPDWLETELGIHCNDGHGRAWFGRIA